MSGEEFERFEFTNRPRGRPVSTLREAQRPTGEGRGSALSEISSPRPSFALRSPAANLSCGGVGDGRRIVGIGKAKIMKFTPVKTAKKYTPIVLTLKVDCYNATKDPNDTCDP